MKFDTTAIAALATQMGVPMPAVVSQLSTALTDAYARTPAAVPGARAVLDADAGELVILDAEDTDVTPGDFGRTAAAAARQALQMWVKDLERIRKVGVWAGREGSLLTGTVRAHSARNAKGEVLLEVGGGVEAVLPAGEQTPGEVYSHGSTWTVIIVAVNATDRDGVRVTISRRQPSLVPALFAQVCPELAEGKVMVTSVARDPGVRVKIAVTSAVSGLSATGALIGVGATRIAAVAEALGAERIDVVAFSPDVETFVAAALTPAKVRSVRLTDPVRHAVEVLVDPDQLARAAGRAGANTRLAMRLTGTRIEILPVA